MENRRGYQRQSKVTAASTTRNREDGPPFGPMRYNSAETREEKAMLDTVEALILDLLEWVANGEKSYEEVMDAWRTSCPRLPVWEDANDRGLITTEHVNGCSIVRITPSGLALLQRREALRNGKRRERPD